MAIITEAPFVFFVPGSACFFTMFKKFFNVHQKRFSLWWKSFSNLTENLFLFDKNRRVYGEGIPPPLYNNGDFSIKKEKI